MNRREILKAAIAIPFVGTGVAKIVQAKDKTPIHRQRFVSDNSRNPNWDNVIVNQGWKTYIESIRVELKRFIGKPATANVDWVLPDFVRFWCGPHIFDISKLEYEKNNAHGRREIPQLRWIDFCWGLNDNINYRIDFIQRFDPEYDPREYRNDYWEGK